MSKTDTTNRERGTGRYTYDVERPCACGHNLGAHAAERVKTASGTVQECFVGGCDCECYKPARKPKAPKAAPEAPKAAEPAPAARVLFLGGTVASVQRSETGRVILAMDDEVFALSPSDVAALVAALKAAL